MHAKSTKPHPEAHATLYTTRYASLTVGMLSFWVRQTRSVGEIIELPFRRLIVREGLNSALTVPNMPTFLYEKVAHFFFFVFGVIIAICHYNHQHCPRAHTSLNAMDNAGLTMTPEAIAASKVRLELSSTARSTGATARV